MGEELKTDCDNVNDGVLSAKLLGKWKFSFGDILPAKVCSWERSSTALPLLAWHVLLFSLLPYNYHDFWVVDLNFGDELNDDDDGYDDSNGVNTTWRKTVFRYSWQNSEAGMSYNLV